MCCLCEFVCSLDVWCVVQAPCAGGRWSSAVGLSQPCANLCDAGYLCTPGSFVSNPQPCGGAQVYCTYHRGDVCHIGAARAAIVVTLTFCSSRVLYVLVLLLPFCPRAAAWFYSCIFFC